MTTSAFKYQVKVTPKTGGETTGFTSHKTLEQAEKTKRINEKKKIWKEYNFSIEEK